VHSFRSRVEGEFVQLATSKRTGIVDGRVMKTLIQTFGRLRSSDAICSEYWRRSADHDLVLSLGAFIFSHFDDLDAVNANCVNAAWKWLSVDSDSWRFAHPEFYAEVFESNVIVSGLSGFPSVLTLSRNFSSGNPREIEDGEKILIDVGSGDAKKTAIWNPQETGIETSDAKFEGEDPPEFGGGHAIDKFKDWAAKNAGVLSLLNQPSMEKISQCRPEILRIFSRGHYIGQASIQKFCPAGILAAAPDSRK